MKHWIGTCGAMAVTLLALSGCGGSGSGTDASTSGASSTAQSASANGAATSTLRAPLISGSPQTTVAVNQAYMFRPTVSASNPGNLTFQISGKPAWASFDSTSGTLSGTPSAADVGVNVGVQISASNGTTSAVIPAFEITVTNGPANSSASNSASSSSSDTATVTLSWTQPTTDTDGTALTNLASYIVYYGTASEAYTNSIVVSNPNELSYVVGPLPAGQTYYFAVKAVTSAGTQSSFSPEVAATI